MNQIFTSAAEAMKVAFALSKQLGRPVWRHMSVDRRGSTIWVVSLEKDPQIALQELTA